MASFLSPLVLRAEPLKALALIPFTKDKDLTYQGFEPQIISRNGVEGLIVIAYRKDDTHDIFYQHQLQIKAEEFNHVGSGVHQMAPTLSDDSFLRYTDKGLDTELIFSDHDGRKIHLHILEKSNKKRFPFGLLAPVGSNSKKPNGIMLLFMENFYFVRRTDTEVSIDIDGTQHELDKFMPMYGSKMYFARFTPMSSCITINPNFEGVLSPLDTNDSTNSTIEINNVKYRFERANDHSSLSEMTTKTYGREVRLKFEPAFPDVRDMNLDSNLSGIFTVSAGASTGVVAGEYNISKSDEEIQISMIPTEGWTPTPGGRPIEKLVLLIAKIFKSWPKTYRWDATLAQNPDGQYYMSAVWRRM